MNLIYGSGTLTPYFLKYNKGYGITYENITCIILMQNTWTWAWIDKFRHTKEHAIFGLWYRIATAQENKLNTVAADQD